jgi:hypothetical protein
MNSAVISDCGLYRYRLDRDVQEKGLVIAYFGINPSTADASIDDHTVRKWRGFTLRNGGRKFIVGNVFSYRATDVNDLIHDLVDCDATHWEHIRQIIEEADILVPCWGRRSKLPRTKIKRPEVLLQTLLESGKPVLHFGTTNSGDPKHPQMLGYDTPLTPWGSDV